MWNRLLVTKPAEEDPAAEFGRRTMTRNPRRPCGNEKTDPRIALDLGKAQPGEPESRSSHRNLDIGAAVIPFGGSDPWPKAGRQALPSGPFSSLTTTSRFCN